MNSDDFNNTICRICMDENVVLDWNNTLVEHDITYKDCYYKYTQLKCLEIDPFSTMLCRNCSHGLENAHSLILQALDSHNFLLDVNCVDAQVDIIVEETSSCIDDETNLEEEETIVEEDISYCSTEFETVLVEKTDTESRDYFEYENDNNEDLYENDNYEDLYENDNYEELYENDNKEDLYENEMKVSVTLKNLNSNSVEKIKSESLQIKSENSIEEYEYHKNQLNESTFQVKKTHARKGESKDSVYKTAPANKRRRNDVKVNASRNCRKRGRKPNKFKVEKKFTSQNTPSMCSICSKILHNKYSLKKHEKTHQENRERNAACPICGVKFFEESYVKTHMQIHNEDRVKKHKCEFCEKDFFEKGALNVHRRIHLGQMIPCSLCSKEFFRQVDLDIHMNSHSAAVINGNVKKRSRYFVRCIHCDKDVLSTSYKAHTAAHLKEPLMKCLVCDKGFYRRDSCTQHLKSIHKKTTEELNDFIITYTKGRLSHLLLEQTTTLVPTHKQ